METLLLLSDMEPVEIFDESFNINAFAGDDDDGVPNIHFDIYFYSPLSTVSSQSETLHKLFLEIFGCCVHEITHFSQEVQEVLSPGTVEYYLSSTEAEAFAAGMSSLARRQQQELKSVMSSYLKTQVQCDRITDSEAQRVCRVWLERADDLIPEIEEKKFTLATYVANDLIQNVFHKEQTTPAAYLCDFLSDSEEFFTVTHSIICDF